MGYCAEICTKTSEPTGKTDSPRLITRAPSFGAWQLAQLEWQSPPFISHSLAMLSPPTAASAELELPAQPPSISDSALKLCPCMGSADDTGFACTPSPGRASVANTRICMMNVFSCLSITLPEWSISLCRGVCTTLFMTPFLSRSSAGSTHAAHGESLGWNFRRIRLQ